MARARYLDFVLHFNKFSPGRKGDINESVIFMERTAMKCYLYYATQLYRRRFEMGHALKGGVFTTT